VIAIFISALVIIWLGDSFCGHYQYLTVFHIIHLLSALSIHHHEAFEEEERSGDVA